MNTTIRMRAEELSERVLSGIRELFKGKTITISIAEIPESEETDYLMREKANRYHLDAAITDIEEGRDLVFFTPEEFEQFVDENRGVQ